MSQIINQRSLLTLLMYMLCAKFLIVPVLDWQNQAVIDIKGKNKQLQKMKTLVIGRDIFAEAAKVSGLKLSYLQDALFKDTRSLKLEAQTELLGIITNNGISVRNFNWVTDSSNSPRILRAKVAYSGTMKQCIQMFWDISMSPRMIQVIGSRQQVKSFKGDALGSIEGSMTLEVYALEEMQVANDLSASEGEGSE